MQNIIFSRSKLRLPISTTLNRPIRRLGSTLCLANRWRRRPWLQPVIWKYKRGVKSKATVPLRELQQAGPESKQPLEEIRDDGSGYPAVVQQARGNMRKFENSVVLTRVGSFYEVDTLGHTSFVAY